MDDVIEQGRLDFEQERLKSAKIIKIMTAASTLIKNLYKENAKLKEDLKRSRQNEKADDNKTQDE